MKKSELADLSVIQQKRYPNQSQQTLEQSKKQVHVCCPFNKSENYNCSICNRLRKVCPYNNQNSYQQNVSSLFQNQQISMYNNRRENQVNLAKRLRIFSLNQSTRKPDTIHKEIKHQISSPAWQKNIYAQVAIPQTEEIIYYPVIHNIVKHQNKEKSAEGTPVRSKRQMDVDDNKILTPTQFKQLFDSFRMQ